MLRLYHSNRLEALLEHLAAVVAEPLADPLAPERIVVQTQGMARWLSLRLAERLGVAANLEFPLPATFVWELFRCQLPQVPDASDFDRDTLLWRVHALLPKLLDTPGYEPLRRYLAQGQRTLKRYQLAARIADLFDQYLVFRPQRVLAWEAGEEEHWQARLWRELARGEEPLHRARLLRLFLDRVRGAGLNPACLPERLCLFGLTALPPAHLEVLTLTAQATDVYLFLLNPSLNYWGDIVADKDLARLRALWRRHGRPDVSNYFEVGNPLLASLGKQGRDFLELLHAYPCEDEDGFIDPGRGGLLATLQRDILMLQRRGPDGEAVAAVAADDRSLQVHGCHSPMREVQVLHDRLLDLFERHPELRPQDVVVMAPDVDRYAPYVEAVFEAVPRERYLPWSVADRRVARERPLVKTLLALLDLPDSRLTASEVVSLLEEPAVRRRLRLDEAAFERMRAWVRDTGIRWGASGAMRAELDLPDVDANTWAFGLQRLLLGYAMPPGAEPYRGTLPYADVEGGDARWVGTLYGFVERLVAWRTRLGQPRPAAEWPRLVNRLAEDLLQPDRDEEPALQSVRDLLDALATEAARADLAEPLDRVVIREHLLAGLEQPGAGERFLTGRVTFCNMVPMRSIPFEVVCLLGMNDREYPRSQPHPAFDLIAAEPQAGDRSRREDDRYLFLEALVSARRVFYVSYVGRDLRDNSVKVPSVLVSELLDAVDLGFSGPGGGPVRAHVVTEHPLQPFSRRYFPGDERLFSFAGEWLPQRAAGTDAPFCPEPLPPLEAEWRALDLSALLRFFRCPTRYLLAERLKVRLDERDEAVVDEEAFALDRLRAFLLRQETLERLLAGEDARTCRARALTAGTLPQGAFADLALRQETGNLEEFAAALRPRLANPLPPLEVTFSAHGLTLSGWLRGATTAGLVRYRSARLRPKDRISLWLEHLALHLAAAAPAQRTSTFIAEDRTLLLPPLDPAQAAAHLADLLALYREGLHRALPFYPDAAWAYAHKRLVEEAPHEAALAEARKFLEAADVAYVKTALRGREPLGEEFERLAEGVFGPVIALAQEQK